MAKARGKLTEHVKPLAKHSEEPLAPTRAPRKRQGEKPTTAITIEPDHFELLRAVAYVRAARDGGRPSVSGVIRDLIEKQRTKLSKEAGPLLKKG